MSSSINDRITCGICLADDMDLPIKMPSCNHHFCFLCAKTWLDVNQTCPLCRQHVDLHVDRLHLTRPKAELASDSEFVWRYSGRNEGFWDYSPQTSQLVEQYYQDWLDHRKSDSDDDDAEDDSGDTNDTNNSDIVSKKKKYEIYVASSTYELDFKNMLQISADSQKRTRRIQRITKAQRNADHDSKGTAGFFKLVI